MSVDATEGDSSSTVDKRDCVLYKIDNSTVDFIFSIANYNSITQGLYFASEIAGGVIQHTVDTNDIINAFKFDSHKDSWVFNNVMIANKTEIYKNDNNDTLFLCIGQPTNEIYTTTGSVFINIDFQIICTTTVFIKYGNKQYIPGMKIFPVSNDASDSGENISMSVLTDKMTLMSELTDKMTSMETFKLLFYLNSVDISKITSLQRTASGELTKETIAQFVKILIAKIDLDNANVNSNSSFLEKLHDKKIITDSNSHENKPISDLLTHLDLFDESIYNSPDVYSNAGRNFTKIFELHREHPQFKELIERIVGNYKKQVTDFTTHIETIQTKPYFSSIIVDMQNYVLNETARPKNIIIINVKTRVPEQKDKSGVRNPMNLRYDVYTDRNRKLLKIDAVDSAFPMYNGQNLKEIGSLINQMTKGEIEKTTGKITYKRKTKVICGPFDDIVSPNENNKTMSEKVKVFKEIKNNLKTKKHVCVYGKGISGSGKTSIMIYNLYGDGLDGQIGALFHLCNNIHIDPDFKCNKITMMRSELCVKQDVCDDDNAEYVFKWEESGVAGFYCISPENFETKHFNDKTKSDCPSSSCKIKNKPLHEVAELLLTKTRKVATTPLNPSSSRSHSALTMKMECYPSKQTEFDCFFTIVDAAGKEKAIECNYSILLRLGNAFADDENNKKETEDLNKNRSYHNDPSNTQESTYSANSAAVGGLSRKSSRAFLSKVPMKRENIRDFTQIDKLVDLVKDTNINTIKNVLHVLSGCAIPKLQENIMSDYQLNSLLAKDRTKFLNEINPTQQFDSENVPSIVEEIKNQLQKMADPWGELPYGGMKKAEKKSQWVKFIGRFVLPHDKEGGEQFLKGKRNVQTTSTTDENNNCTQKQYLSNTKKTEKNSSCIHEIYIKKSTPDSTTMHVKVVTPKSGTTVTSENIKTLGGVDDFYIVDENNESTNVFVCGNQGKTEKNWDTNDNHKYVKEDIYVYKPEVKYPDWLTKRKIYPTDSATQDNYTAFYAEFDKFTERMTIINRASDPFYKEFSSWKSGKNNSITIFITQNHKITLEHISNYRDDTTPAVQLFMQNNYNSEPSKSNFYKDAVSVSAELDRFFEVTTFIKTHCDERSKESLFINKELDVSDDVINAICVTQNEGRPTMPLYGILKNNEYYKFSHVHNILKGMSFDGNLISYIKKSRIIDSIFEMTCKLSNTSIKQKQQTCVEEIARAISFFFFTVINLSPDTEMPDRVQYYHTLTLRTLLKQMKYDSEFKNFNEETKKEYVNNFNACTKEILEHYNGETQNLSRVAEISMLISNIANAQKNLGESENYEQAIYHVDSIVSETNSINRSTIIGSIANDGDTCILQKDAGIDLITFPWQTVKPKEIMG